MRHRMTAIAGSIHPRPIIGVLGSGTERHEQLAEPLGTWIAQQGFHLLTGGGGGAMAAVCQAFVAVPDHLGLTIGVLPTNAESSLADAPPGYPNRWVELAIRTHLPRRGAHGRSPLSRNHINVLSADVLIALPGGSGTMSEIELAVRYGRPCVAFLSDRIQGLQLPQDIPVAKELSDVATYVLDSVSNRL